MAGRKPIRNPQALQAPRVLTPIDQLSQRYGGRAAMEASLADAEELARQLSAIDDIDGGRYREMFPEIDYSAYSDDMAVLPMGEGDPRGSLYRPTDADIADAGVIQLRDGQTMNAPELAEEMPSIAFGNDPASYGNQKIAFEGEVSDLTMQPDALMALNKQRMSQGIGNARMYDAVEGPMTDYVTGTPSDAFEPMTDARIFGSDIDRVLAQIRRSSGATSLEPNDARRLIADAVERSQMVGDPDMIDGTTGLRMGELEMLQMLGPEQRAFLPKRIRELLSLGGITTGLLSQGGQQDRPQGINPRSTMGPLSGLTDF